MILYLTDSLKINNEDERAYVRAKHCFRNIANSAIEGSHIVRGDLDILDFCCRMFEGDDEFFMFFRSLVNNFATLTVPSDITYYVEVVKENPVEKEVDGCIIAQRVLDDFYFSDSLLCCQLVCEDENDCRFYDFVAEWYLKKENLRYNLKLSKNGGGGGRTIEKVRNHLEANRICLCIVDTDQRFPEMEMNEKSRACKMLDKKKCGYRCLVINVHEIENILPVNYIDDLIATDHRYHWEKSQDFKRHYDYLSCSSEVDSILPFFDYKNGIKKNAEFVASEDFKRFGELCWKQNPEINKGQSFDEYVNSVPYNGVIYSQLSASIATDILKYIYEKKQSGTLTSPKLLDFQNHEWNRIGKEIVNWSCARIPEGIS